MFGSKNSSTDDSITREEASQYVDGLSARLDTLRSEGVSEVESLRTALGVLGDRVTSLERLARQLRTGQAADRASTVGVARRQAEAVVARSVAATTTDADNDDVVAPDYGAIAFGLSEINRKITTAFGNDAHVSDQITAEHEGAVQYFADVFAKADPGFDERAFKIAAGVNPPREPYVRSHP